jgi:hypothetical protein
MNNWLKFETPSFVYLGPFMNSDGITVNTGLSLSQGDIWLTRNGNAFFSLVDASAIVHSMLGYYRIPLGSTDLGSTGRLRIMCNKATALPVWDNWSVVTSKVYDSIITGTDYLEVDALQVEGTDATNQIRDSIVDDATRIDASALNTLAGHDPGETIMGATDTVAANVTQIGGVVQSLTDLKDLIDTGYDPTTHKIAGVVLVDAVTILNGLANDIITAASINADAQLTPADIGDAVHDEVVEGTTTFRQMIRLFASALTGLMAVTDNGDGTHTYTFRDIGNTKDRIVIIVHDTTKDRDTITTRDGS